MRDFLALAGFFAAMIAGTAGDNAPPLGAPRDASILWDAHIPAQPELPRGTGG